MKLFGNLFIALSVLGLIALLLVAAEVHPPWSARSSPAVAAIAQPGGAVAVAAPLSVPQPRLEPASGSGERPAVPLATTSGPTVPAKPTEEPRLQIDRIEIPRVGLDAPVVPAGLVHKDGALTWEIPAQKAGHADGTAGAGDKGNAVLLGHVNSLRSGDVFKDLDKVGVGDRITIHSGGSSFSYEVISTQTTDRADTSMVQTTETPSLTLFTCTGAWLPTIWDYTHRLVVRAELR